MKDDEEEIDVDMMHTPLPTVVPPQVATIDPQGCTAADYAQASLAIIHAMTEHARFLTTSESSAYKANLSPEEFHNRCMRLAMAIAFNRTAAASTTWD